MLMRLGNFDESIICKVRPSVSVPTKVGSSKKIIMK